MKCSIDIYFPIVSNYEFEKYPFEQQESILNDIQKVLKKKQFISEKHITRYNIKLNIIAEAPYQIIQNPNIAILNGLNEAALNFSINVNVNLDNFVVTSNLGGTVERITNHKELIVFLPYMLSEEFGNKIFEILVLSQIARPGSLKLREGVIWINKKRQSKTIPAIINLRESYEYYLNKGYPKIDFINFQSYYSWLHLNNLIFNEKPINSYQKAINNFSHLNGDSGRTNRLIYQMMTLEQLYTKGVYQLSEQLNIKIQIYLGEIKSYKRQIKNMYDIRSRFLHGDLSILPFHKEHPDWDNCPPFEHELEDAEHLSVLLIISTLQKMFKDIC